MMTPEVKQFIEKNASLLDSSLQLFFGKASTILPPVVFEQLIETMSDANIEFDDIRTELLKNKFSFIFPTVVDYTPLVDVIFDNLLYHKDVSTYFGLTIFQLVKFVEKYADHWKDDMHLEVNRYSNIVVRTDYDH